MTDSTPVALPPAVDRYEYWIEPPPEPSPRLCYWLVRLAKAGSICQAAVLARELVTGEGYDYDAEHAGVYLWEWHHVLYHVVWNRIRVAEGRCP